MIPICPLRLKRGGENAVRTGMPWIYASELIASSELLLIPPGSLVAIETHKGEALGTGYYNANSQIACRVLTLEREAIDAGWFKAKLAKALALRERLIDAPYYRLVHSEGDLLPGLLIDRFGDYSVIQAGTAGMERLQPLWLEALEQLFNPKAILLRNDSKTRLLECLPQETTLIKGEVQGRLEVRENGFAYVADLLHGQKTGWFYDQRDNRRMIAGLANGKTLLDIYAHSGGFALLAAHHGAARATLVDSSALALELAQAAAQHNNMADRCDYLQGDAFAVMERLRRDNKRFGIVLADPPAFVKSKKDLASGLKGYMKTARLAASLVEPGGWFFIASCSHHATRQRFTQAVLTGIAQAGRRATILRQTAAAPDHPRHKQLPQNDYLKGILLRMED